MLDYKNYNIEALKQGLNDIPWEICSKERSFNRAYESFKSLLTSIINKYCPLKQVKFRGRDNLWFTNEIVKKMLTSDFYLKRGKNSLYKNLKHQVNNMVKLAKANCYRSLFEENMSNPKCFWKQIKKCYPQNLNRALARS